MLVMKIGTLPYIVCGLRWRLHRGIVSGLCIRGTGGNFTSADGASCHGSNSQDDCEHYS